LLLVGCADHRPPRGKVSGIVTYQSKPVPTGTVTFFPKAGGPTAQGDIGPDGRYELTTFDPGDGAVLGSHSVMIEAWRLLPTDPTKDGMPNGVMILPPKYSNPSTSGLTAEVQAGENTIHFTIDPKTK
jgi:hypothetical protein